MAKKQFRCFGVIVDDDSQRWAPEDVTPAQFAQFLKFCDPADEIELMINSPGGSVSAGLAIANMIKVTKQPVTARVYGIAASMASVIATAAPKLAMFKNSFMMVHNPWTIMMGDANALKKEADKLETMKASIIDFYQSKFPTLQAEELSKLMDEETWMLGSEASAYGLLADIEDDPEDRAVACIRGPAMFARIPDAAKKYYVGDPEMKHLAQKPDEPTPAGQVQPPPPEPPARSPEVLALVDQLESANLRAQQAEARIDQLTADVATLKTERDAAQAAAAKAEEQRRDHQSKADKLAKDLELARAEHKAAADQATQQISSLNAEKGKLETRIASITLNALRAPSNDCAQSWDDALVECGSYEAAKAKYPHLAEAYRLAHTPKGDPSAAD